MAAPDVHDAILSALQPWMARHRRRAWRPVISNTADRTSRSFFGGRPWLVPGEAWPACGACASRLDLFVQLDGAALPNEAHPIDGLLQFFYCRACDAGNPTWEAFSKYHSVRIVHGADVISSDLLPDDTAAERPLASPLAALPQRPIAGWEGFDDLPHPEEFDLLGLQTRYEIARNRMAIECASINVHLKDIPLGLQDEHGRELAEAIGLCATGDKLGGWPYWIQGMEYPNCPRCEERMEYLLQIDSNCNIDHMFGDMGCGHITRCRRHPDVLAFAWACS